MNLDVALTTRLSRTALLALAITVAPAACSKSAQKPPSQEVPVTVAPASRADVPFEIQANGVVSPLSTSAITAQVDGIITHVFFREGQDVAKGALLFQIEARPYQAAYQQALANLARDRETNANAQKEVARYQALVKQDYVTQEQADQQKATAARPLPRCRPMRRRWRTRNSIWTTRKFARPLPDARAGCSCAREMSFMPAERRRSS
jgi:Multidrug resistance efflux pump